jgi:hypothetical protein
MSRRSPDTRHLPRSLTGWACALIRGGAPESGGRFWCHRRSAGVVSAAAGSTRRLRLAAARCVGRPAPSPARHTPGPQVEQNQPGRGAGARRSAVSSSSTRSAAPVPTAASRRAPAASTWQHAAASSSPAPADGRPARRLSAVTRNAYTRPRSAGSRLASTLSRTSSCEVAQPRSPSPAGLSSASPVRDHRMSPPRARGRRRLQHQEGEPPHAASKGCAPRGSPVAQKRPGDRSWDRLCVSLAGTAPSPTAASTRASA